MSFVDRQSEKPFLAFVLAALLCACGPDEPVSLPEANGAFNSATRESSLSGGDGPEAEAVLKDISARGARSVLAELVAADDDAAFEAVLGKVGSGDERWIEVAERLADGSDASTSIGLKVALAYALPKNPEAVLRVADTRKLFTVSEICRAPFIEPETKFLSAYLEEAHRALMAVSAPELETRRVACLGHIDQSLARLRAEVAGAGS